MKRSQESQAGAIARCIPHSQPPLLALVLLALLVDVGPARAASSFAFTYQGRLTQNGGALNGSYDFLFLLQNEDTGVSLATNQLPAVSVSGGLFTVSLDFGQEVFDGTRRSLQIGVRPHEDEPAAAPLAPGGGAPAPAAIPPGFAFLTPATKIGSIPVATIASKVAIGSITAFSLSGISGSLPVSSIISVSPGGTFIPILPSSVSWDLLGNSGTTSTNFLGTKDNQPLELRVNNLRALRLEPNGTSPNLVGGHRNNFAGPGVAGATIGGGGRTPEVNAVTANFATVAGGLANAATNTYAAVSGGAYNVAGGYAAVVGGGGGFGVTQGLTNAALGHWSVISGGRENTARGESSSISGGERNEAGGNWAAIGGGVGHATLGSGTTIGGGGFNAAAFDWATVSGGHENAAQALESTVGGGVGNYTQPPAVAATIGGGANNLASGVNSVVPGGYQAHATQYGQLAHASGYFQNNGDAQSSVYVLRAQSDLVGPTRPLSLDGGGTPLRIAPNRTMTFEILITARNLPDPGPPPIPPQSAGYSARGVIKNDGGLAQFVGGPTVTTLGEDDPNWNVTLSTAGDALVITVTSGAASPVPTIRWVARVQAAETAW